MGARQSSTSKIQVTCNVNNNGACVKSGDRLSGTIHLKVGKNAKNWEEFDGIILSLVAKEVWTVGGRRVKNGAKKGSKKIAQVDRLVTDFAGTEVGDGIDFTFSFVLDVPELPAGYSKGELDIRQGLPELERSFDSISTLKSEDESEVPVREVRYKIETRLRRRDEIPDMIETRDQDSAVRRSNRGVRVL